MTSVGVLRSDPTSTIFSLTRSFHGYFILTFRRSVRLRFVAALLEKQFESSRTEPLRMSALEPKRHESLPLLKEEESGFVAERLDGILPPVSRGTLRETVAGIAYVDFKPESKIRGQWRRTINDRVEHRLLVEIVEPETLWHW